jgi:hypothetical protein
VPNASTTGSASSWGVWVSRTVSPFVMVWWLADYLEVVSPAPDSALFVGGALVVPLTTVPAGGTKVDVCPVDDDGDFHLIDISENAFEKHVDHGDASPGEGVPGMDGFEFDDDCVPFHTLPLALALCESYDGVLTVDPPPDYWTCTEWGPVEPDIYGEFTALFDADGLANGDAEARLAGPVDSGTNWCIHYEK